MRDIPKAYDPAAVEDGIYERWEESGFFIPENLPNYAQREPFTIVLPPPNATGTLHIGHAMMLAVEDAMIRFARMNGKRALWVPGTDHAALATQNKVEKIIWNDEKKTRHDLGREELLRRVDDFVQGSRDRIRLQLRKMGSSLDWSREAFTLDEPRCRAVRTLFKQMYDAGLIYRGERVINWCARCASTLSDDEVETVTRSTTLYHFKYHADVPVTIATTQPETKLGDAAIAVHPSDERYSSLIGRVFEIPFGGAGGVKLSLRVIADRTVEKEFGTGALGVTPAHSMVDYLMALEHGLPLHKIIGPDGLMTDAAGTDYAHLTVREAREKIIAWLRAEKLIEKEETVEQNVPVCSRCETEINPLPMLQWFVGVNKPFGSTTLKEAMRHVVASQQIKIIPDRFEKTYFHWINNLRDWCISRQIWYGHRIPVWYCAGRSDKPFRCADPTVSVDDITICPNCGGGVTQDPDVLDTWFSSGAWTFSTLGWPYTRLLLVRHGEAMSNIQNIMDAETDDPENGLTERGRAQVAECAQQLHSEHPTIIVASPVRRTRETAEILSRELGVEVRFDERLHEVATGELEGKSISAFLKARGPLDRWFNDSPHGIESYAHLHERCTSFMEDVLREYVGHTVMVVTHGGIISLLNTYGQSGAEISTEDYPHNGCALVREFDASGSPTGDLNVYHPTDVLETGYDILFIWVARMILMSLFALGEVPFRTVYLHGLVRDEQGRKMSKSLGNVIDPLDVAPKYGTDAVRLSLLIGQSPGNDLRMSEEKIAGFRNFTNKLWNISRYILMQDGEGLPGGESLDDAALTELDKWILSRLASVTEQTTRAMERYEFSRAGELLRDFTWGEFADWYIEGAKVEGAKQPVLHFVLRVLLRLWHPFMPFVTETIWQQAYSRSDTDFLMIAPWPVHTEMTRYPEAEASFARAQGAVVAIRALRQQYSVPAGAIIPVTIISPQRSDLALFQPIIERLARCEILFADSAPEGQVATVTEDGTITMPQPETGADARVSLEAQLDETLHYAQRLEEKLANQEFLAHAPAAVVESERAKLHKAQEKIAALRARL